MRKAIIKVPKKLQRGDIAKVKVLIRHNMESGQRRDNTGARIARNIINQFQAHYLGDVVFDMSLFSGIAANPYLEFKFRVEESGVLVCRWEDDSGKRVEQQVEVNVS